MFLEVGGVLRFKPLDRAVVELSDLLQVGIPFGTISLKVETTLSLKDGRSVSVKGE